MTSGRTAPAAVEVSGWGWQYAGRTHPSLRGVTLSITPGERVLLLGASGSGKSTFVQALAGVLAPDMGDAHGTMRVNGADPRQRLGATGLLLQNPENQILMERVGDDVAFGCENLGVPRDEIWQRVAHALQVVGLDVALDHPTHQLSGGQKQRLALAGIIAMRPGLVVLDEPTAQLDPAGAHALRRALDELVGDSEPTVVLVEHRTELWWDFATRVVVLSPEGVIWDGAPTDITAEQANTLRSQGMWMPEHLFPRTSGSPALAAASSPALGDALLEVRSLRAGYPASHATPTPSVDLTLRAGEVLALSGANGVGKSATALTVAGLLRPVGGSVRAADQLRTHGRRPARSAEPHRWGARQLVGRIGSVFQSPEHQFVRATVRQELELAPRQTGATPAQARVIADELLERLGLAPLAQAHPFTLSGGQQRRLSVGTALAATPPVLVLDEPTFGQDARTWQALADLVLDLASQGTAVLAVSHDEQFVARVAHRTQVLA
jgi:energy-coupling factor transporter ATP-binding protein EcfA2